jgi:hypothetical protein
MAQDSSGTTGIHLTDTSGVAAFDDMDEFETADRAGTAYMSWTGGS